jgi:hypothetical protein
MTIIEAHKLHNPLLWRRVMRRPGVEMQQTSDNPHLGIWEPTYGRAVLPSQNRIDQQCFARSSEKMAYQLDDAPCKVRRR